MSGVLINHVIVKDNIEIQESIQRPSSHMPTKCLHHYARFFPVITQNRQVFPVFAISSITPCLRALKSFGVNQ
jgi:hypothetical protein